jgi:hypothetical protein
MTPTRGKIPSAAPLRETRGGPTDPSHDLELRRGIIRTAVRRPVALALVGGFLLLIYGVPLAQALLEKKNDEPSMLLDVFTRPPTRESFKQYEDDLDNASYFKQAVQPRMQLVLTARGGVGNKRAVVGRQRQWLYFQPGVLAVGGPGFLEPEIQRGRQKAALDDGGAAIHPDPRPAVLALHQALAARGIALVLFPVPDKASLQPAELHGRVSPGKLAVALNPDHHRFVAEMRSKGVLVFDAAPATLATGEPPRFLVQDTHWTPAWMETVAAGLATFVRAHVKLAEGVAPPRWRVVPTEIARVGDIVDMLKLPEGQRLFLPQQVVIRQVRDEGGQLWQPKEDAEVLLLGDSFTNVFSQAPMGWGEAAGLAPHLAIALGRELDVIAQNDSGAFATRKLLSEALGAGEDRLAGKKVVIWELAARELAVGDWKPFSYQLGKKAAAPP